MNKIRTYSELIKIPTFEERFEYLKLDGIIGEETFGFDRYINQLFYRSPEWRSFRNKIIIRDNACDLGIPGRDIRGKAMLLIHHMNPITKEQIQNGDPDIMNPEYVITTMRSPTHEAIHYGDASILLGVGLNERVLNDTCLWK